MCVRAWHSMCVCVREFRRGLITVSRVIPSQVSLFLLPQPTEGVSKLEYQILHLELLQMKINDTISSNFYYYIFNII